MEKLLVVDDNAEILKQLKWGLGKDYKVFIAGEAGEALKVFKGQKPKVVTLDLGVPPDADGASEGLRCLREMLACDPAAKVIVITGNDDRANALQAVELGAYDYYQKPIELGELRIILERAFQLAALETENRRLQASLESEQTVFGGIFGQSPQMLEIYQTIRKVATCDVPVLILGESGTGKELAARAIHEQSLRQKGPFIAINCGAIPDNLLESELFGHEKGSFTGAHALVKGKVEYAAGGTLFLDEIGELPVALQVKILRFLQEQLIQRVGGREDIPVDARIIAATNLDLQQAMAEGAFREDLFYRLGVITMDMPALRAREDDVILLASLFLRRFAEAFGKRIRGYSAAAQSALQAYAWPGNVRELENKVKRAVILSEGAMIEPVDLGLAISGVEPAQPTASRKATLREARETAEREVLTAALERHEGNLVRAAETLGVSRPTLYDLLKKHHLHHPGG